MPVLNVSIKAPEDSCDDACDRKVSLTIAESLNLWRHLCLRCNVGLFSFLVIEKDVFADARVWSVLSDRSKPLFSRILEAHKLVLGLQPASSPPQEYAIDSYAMISKDNPALQDLCAVNIPALKSLWPGILKSLVCDSNPEPRSEDGLPVLNISFIKENPCGTASYLACGNPAKKVDLNVSDTLYTIRDLKTHAVVPVLGNSRAKDVVDLHAVVLHEIGHFLGLGHLQPSNQPASFPAVMLATYHADFCVSIAETMMLNSAADRNWRYQAKTCSGLLRPSAEARR